MAEGKIFTRGNVLRFIMLACIIAAVALLSRKQTSAYSLYVHYDTVEEAILDEAFNRDMLPSDLPRTAMDIHSEFSRSRKQHFMRFEAFRPEIRRLVERLHLLSPEEVAALPECRPTEGGFWFGALKDRSPETPGALEADVYQTRFSSGYIAVERGGERVYYWTACQQPARSPGS